MQRAIDIMEKEFVACIDKAEARNDMSLITKAGFYPRNFVYSFFSPNIQFLYYFLSSVAAWGCPMADTEGKMFEMLVCKLLENAFFKDFS